MSIEIPQIESETKFVLRRIFPTLSEWASNAKKDDNHFRISYDSYYPVSQKEIADWSQTHELENVIFGDLEKGDLFKIQSTTIPQIGDININYKETITAGMTSKLNLSPIRAPEQVKDRFGYNINKYPISKIVPFSKKDYDESTLVITPHFYLSSESRKDRLYNAFVSLGFYIFDKSGLPIVSKIPGTGPRPNYENDLSIYSPYSPISIDCWFNTDIKENGENSLNIDMFRDNASMIHAKVHQPKKLNSLEIPQNDKLRLFFHQIYNLMHKSSKNNSIPSIIDITNQEQNLRETIHIEGPINPEDTYRVLRKVKQAEDSAKHSGEDVLKDIDQIISLTGDLLAGPIKLKRHAIPFEVHPFEKLKISS